MWNYIGVLNLLRKLFCNHFLLLFFFCFFVQEDIKMNKKNLKEWVIIKRKANRKDELEIVKNNVNPDFRIKVLPFFVCLYWKQNHLICNGFFLLYCDADVVNEYGIWRDECVLFLLDNVFKSIKKMMLLKESCLFFFLRVSAC